MRYLAVLLAACVVAAALEYRPVTVGFVPPLSTNGLECGNVVSGFSFNVIGGYIGAVRGFELGGVFNIDRYYVDGWQVAGAFNLVGGRLRGVQVSPVNIALGLAESDSRTVHAFRHDVVGWGCQLGSANLNLLDFSGAQVGSFNLGHRVRGVQVGACNIAGRIDGVQVGACNIAGRIDGFSLASASIAGEGRGFMLGTVNICGRLDGEALGVASIVGNGYNAFSVWADETGIPQLGAKLGSRHVYNLFAAGAAPAAEPELRWLAGYGLGGHFPLGSRFFVDTDLAGYIVSAGTDPLGWNWEAWRVFARLRPQFGWNITGRLALVAGPTLNYFSSAAPGGRLSAFTIGSYEGRAPGGSLWYRVWGGLSLGLQFR